MPPQNASPAPPPKLALWTLVKKTYTEWSNDNASRLAAAFSYYTIFSIGPLLIIAIYLVSFIYGNRAANDQIRPQITNIVGDKAAEFIQDLIKNAHFSPSFSFAGIISAILILYAATNMFVSLQNSLNVVFNVVPRPDRGILGFIKDRALTFLMVFIVGVFILVSIALSTLLAAVTGSLPGNPEITALLLQIANFLIAAIIFTGIFALMFKYLPDIKIDWHDTLLGAAFTAILFSVARFALGYYLGRSSTAGPFGAAGSLVIVMLFIYYSSQIFFLGAEFTQVWACRHGRPIVPSKNAIVAPSHANAKKQPVEQPPPGSEQGKWVKAGGDRGWKWVEVGNAANGGGKAAEKRRSGGGNGRQEVGRRHLPGPAKPLATASVAALLVLPVALFYLHRRS